MDPAPTHRVFAVFMYNLASPALLIASDPDMIAEVLAMRAANALFSYFWFWSFRLLVFPYSFP